MVRTEKASLIAMAILLMTGSQAAQARAMYVCPQLDSATGKLSVRVSTGCMTGMARYKDNTLALDVDQNHAMIKVTGDITYHPIESPIVTGDCAGAKSITLEAANVEARRYSVSYDGVSLGLADLIENPAPKACLSVRSAADPNAYPTVDRSIYADWSQDMIAGWRDWRGSDPVSLMAPLLANHPEGEKGNPTLSFSFGKRHWVGIGYSLPPGRRPFLGVTIERQGFLDDSVAGDRYFAELRFEDGAWRIEHLWGQWLCARGHRAGQWSAELCA